MANRQDSSGLTIGQLLTLTLGFVVASVVIFVFGLWVGRDLAEQRTMRERDVLRMPVTTPAQLPTTSPITETPIAAPPTVTAVVSTPTSVPVPTATRERPPVAAAPTTARPPVSTRRPAPTVRGAWTVQATATDDAVRAVILARRLRAKGYDAYTVQRVIRGVTWYSVRVGRFRDRTSAKVVEARLRSEEGLEAAYVTDR